MVMMLLVLAVMFFTAPLRRTLMRGGQVGCAARLRTYRAQRNQPLDILGLTNRASYLRTRSPLEMLKSMITLEALVLENRHRAIPKDYPNQTSGDNRFWIWNDTV